MARLTMREYLDQRTLKDSGERGRRVGKELRKQAIDQTLHWLWAFATTFAPFAASAWIDLDVSVGWVMVGSFASLCWIVGRETLQWPSERWWDPALDWSVFALGFGHGIVAGIVLTL